MSKKVTKPFEFSTLSKWLHWGSLFLLTVMFVAGLTMTNLEDGDPLKLTIYRLHGITGLLIILMTLARIVIRLRRPQPTPEGMTEKWNIWPVAPVTCPACPPGCRPGQFIAERYDRFDGGSG